MNPSALIKSMFDGIDPTTKTQKQVFNELLSEDTFRRLTKRKLISIRKEMGGDFNAVKDVFMLEIMESTNQLNKYVSSLSDMILEEKDEEDAWKLFFMAMRVVANETCLHQPIMLIEIVPALMRVLENSQGQSTFVLSARLTELVEAQSTMLRKQMSMHVDVMIKELVTGKSDG